jgi:hypothetical protein
MVVSVTPSELVTETLNELEVTEREFRELRYSLPLSRALGRRVLSADPGRVLLVGLDGLLAQSLQRIGLDCDAAELEATGFQPSHRKGTRNAVFGTIVVAFPPQAENPERLLWRLSNELAPAGRMILALRQPVPRRRPGPNGMARASAAASGPLSVSLVESWSRAAGLRVIEAAPVVAEEAWRSETPLSLMAWLRAETSHALRRAVPGLRDCIVVTLEPAQAKKPAR